MNHPTPLVKEVGGNGRAAGWFRNLRRNVLERTVLAGYGIRIDHTANGSIIAIANARRAAGGAGEIDVRKATVAADPLSTADVVQATIEGESSARSIALPWLLRKTPFDGETRNEVSYTYVTGDNATRDATMDSGTYTERQTIISPYVENDEIYVVKVGSETTGVTNVEWLDLNVDARAWALLYNFG